MKTLDLDLGTSSLTQYLPLFLSCFMMFVEDSAIAVQQPYQPKYLSCNGLSGAHRGGSENQSHQLSTC